MWRRWVAAAGSLCDSGQRWSRAASRAAAAMPSTHSVGASTRGSRANGTQPSGNAVKQRRCSAQRSTARSWSGPWTRRLVSCRWTRQPPQALPQGSRSGRCRNCPNSSYSAVRKTWLRPRLLCAQSTTYCETAENSTVRGPAVCEHPGPHPFLGCTSAPAASRRGPVSRCHAACNGHHDLLTSGAQRKNHATRRLTSPRPPVWVAQTVPLEGASGACSA